MLLPMAMVVMATVALAISVATVADVDVAKPFPFWKQFPDNG